MVRSKALSKKQQKRGIDFKKIKRKIGRKLPPPKNATNTEIKSKAIILPEQSVASEKTGLAVSRKGLTLRELLQQTSHHNPKVRKDALIGIRDIFLKYPAELKLHKLAVIEKLRERISDDDKLVRETLYQLLKSVIFPGCKEDNQGPFISLMMSYIFNAMTHLAVDVRLMAFKFFDLVVQHYPSSFSLHAEKILQNYEDILRKNQFYLQDKGKLKGALVGLVRCLSILPCNMRGDNTSSEKEANAREILHSFEPDQCKDSAGYSTITQKLKDLIPVLVSCFQDFVPLVHAMPLLDAQSFDCMLFILQSIDLVVRFFVYGIGESQQQLRASKPPHEGPGITTWGQTVSPVLLKKLFDVFPLNSLHHLPEKDDHRCFVLNVIITETFLRLSDRICPPTALLEKFLEFIESALSKKVYSSTHSVKAFEKQLVSLTSFLPKLVLQVVGNWRSRILQAFTNVFKSCNPESALKLACLSAIEEMLVPGQNLPYLDSSDPEILDYQITWIRELPLLLILLDDRHPSASKVVFHLLLRLGQCAPLNSSFIQEYDNMQYSLREFYSSCLDERTICYGPFIRLSRDSQELSVCCLSYFSLLDSLLLKSLALCCLCHDLEPFVLFRIIEVLHSAYKAGHIQITDHISFFITLTSCFKVLPERICPIMEKDEISNRGTFKSITSVVCSCLSQMGDDYLVLQILEKVILDQISLKPPLDNTCALLRMLVTLDSMPTRLSEQSIINLSSFLPGYLIDVVFCIPEGDDESTISIRTSSSRYYLLPCFILFYRINKLLNLVLNMMGSLVAEKSSSLFCCTCIRSATDHSSRITSIVSILLLMRKDIKIQRILSSCKAEIDCILQNILVVQSSEQINMTIEERHKVQCAFDRLKTVTST
ncbi:uncharacterized protein LOC132313744 [Cornus florida]|uniref:uncharacterized protein LOC132313744 n=1 Tax=Cornus florida TaxID=4283 RepID=UPI00289E6E5D|nr:uncharacterized protein LOC132313744 [Cornus florida]XP_059668654.1 uncharacterized protein LOC132313744 [Cornus florida]